MKGFPSPVKDDSSLKRLRTSVLTRGFTYQSIDGKSKYSAKELRLFLHLSVLFLKVNVAQLNAARLAALNRKGSPRYRTVSGNVNFHVPP